MIARPTALLFPNGNESANFSKAENYQPAGALYLEQNYWLMVFTAFVIGGAALIGTLGNILIILAVFMVRTLRTAGNILVVNLSLADLVVTVLIDPFNVIGAVAGREYLIKNPALCEWIASFCAPACMSSMWNMCAISLNRYVLICKPHLYKKIFSYPLTILYCICIWVLAHLLHMPNHLGWGRNRFDGDYYLCTFDIVLHSYAAFYVVTGVIIPLIGVLFGYSKIFLKVSSVKSQLRNYQQAALARAANPNKDEENQREKPKFKRPGYTSDDVKLAKTLFAAFLVFLICWLPFSVFVLANQPSQIPKWVYVIAIIMAHGNSAVNPILYGATNEKFREGYREVLGLRRPGVAPTASSDRKPIRMSNLNGGHETAQSSDGTSQAKGNDDLSREYH